MNFISYAQNLEDVILWRALSHVSKGFYVDVGAQDPLHESVTMAFYQRGWRGINIEPNKQYFEKLTQQRPEDINIMVAAGRGPARIPFYLVTGTGLSTAQPDIVENYRNDGFEVETDEVTVTSLNNILEIHSAREIHFLKIDVEGFELDVLLGLDLRKWRPWILVVEATLPNSREVDYESWDGLIREQGYQFVYFDGLNRFYLADEKSDLAVFFQSPPNVFDRYSTAKEEWLESLVKNLESEIVDLKGGYRQQTDENERRYSQLAEAYELMTINHENLKNELIENQNKYIKSLEMNSIHLQEINSIQRDFQRYRNGIVSAITEILPGGFTGEPEQLKPLLQGLKDELAWVNTEWKKSQYDLHLIYQSKTYKLTEPFRRIYWLIIRLPNHMSTGTRSVLRNFLGYSSRSVFLRYVKYPFKKIAPVYWERTRLRLWNYSTGGSGVIPKQKMAPIEGEDYFHNLFSNMIN